MEKHEFALNLAKALDNRLRFEIMTALAEQDCTVNELAKQVGASQSATSQHITVLKNARLITGEKSGLHVTYRLNRQYMIEGFKEFVRLLEGGQDEG